MTPEIDVNPETGENSTEKQLCLNCLYPNAPAAHFCSNCGAPTSSYAATAPLERIYAEGFAYRQAAEKPRKFIVVLGIWIIFGSSALGAIAMLFGSLGDGSLYYIIGSSLVISLSLAIMAKTTRNYFKELRTPPALARLTAVKARPKYQGSAPPFKICPP